MMTRPALKKLSLEQPDWRSMKTCSLDISLNNRYQTGQYLYATLLWVNKRFENCIINLGDTLHRYNLEVHSRDIAQSHDIAQKMGNQWIENNKQFFDVLNVSYTLVRNDDWLNAPGFNEIHNELWSFYYADSEFRYSVANSIDGFLSRKGNPDQQRTHFASLAYLMEETAADILFGQKQAVVHLYPGEWHEHYFHLMKRSHEIPEKLKGLEQCAFKRLTPSKTLQASNTNIKITGVEALSDAV